MFNQNTEQFAEVTNNAIDAAYGLLQTSLNSIEKLTKIQLDASKKVLDDASQTIKDITQTSSSKSIFDKVNQLTTSTVENNVNNCRDAYEVFSEAQAQLGKVFETYFQAAGQSVSNTVDSFAKFNPAKATFTTDSLKTFANNATQAIQSLSKVTSQVAEFANNNIKAATNATASAVKKSSSAAAKK